MLNASFVDVQFFRNFPGAPLLKVFEHEANAFNFGQARKRFGKMALELMVQERLVGAALKILDVTLECLKDAWS